MTSPSFFVRAFHKELEYCNADARIDSGDDPATSDPVKIPWTWSSNSGVSDAQLSLNCVQQASISTRVSLTAFARGGAARNYGDQYSVLSH